MYRLARCAIVFVCLCSATAAQEKKNKPGHRFGFDVDETTYPQKTPTEAMASIAKVLDRKRVDFLLAQLADPTYVDYWVDEYKVEFTQGKEEGKRFLAFDRLTRETIAYYENDPLIVKDLRVFAKDAKWSEEEGVAVGTVETIPARKVFLKKVGDRWFLENKQQ